MLQRDVPYSFWHLTQTSASIIKTSSNTNALMQALLQELPKRPVAKKPLQSVLPEQPLVIVWLLLLFMTFHSRKSSGCCSKSIRLTGMTMWSAGWATKNALNLATWLTGLLLHDLDGSDDDDDDEADVVDDDDVVLLWLWWSCVCGYFLIMAFASPKRSQW